MEEQFRLRLAVIWWPGNTASCRKCKEFLERVQKRVLPLLPKGVNPFAGVGRNDVDSNDGGIPWASNSNWGWFKLENLIREAEKRLPEDPNEDKNVVMPWSMGEKGGLAQDLRIQEELVRRGMRPTDQAGKVYELPPRVEGNSRSVDVVKGLNWSKIMILRDVNASQQCDSGESDQEREDLSDNEYLVLDDIGPEDSGAAAREAPNPSVNPLIPSVAPGINHKNLSVVPGVSSEKISPLMSLKVDRPVDFTPPRRAVWLNMHGRCVNCKAKGHMQYQCPEPKRKKVYCPICFRDGMTRGNCKFCKNDA